MEAGGGAEKAVLGSTVWSRDADGELDGTGEARSTAVASLGSGFVAARTSAEELDGFPAKVGTGDGRARELQRLEVRTTAW